MDERRYPQRRKCLVDGCTNHRSRHRPACWHHWSMLPEELRAKILVSPPESDEFLLVCRKALAWLASRKAAIERTVESGLS